MQIILIYLVLCNKHIGLAIWRLKCFYETFVQDSTFVLRIKFSACRKFSASKSASSPSAKTLGVSLAERKNTRQNNSTTKRIIATAERNIATAERNIATAERIIATAKRIIATAKRNIATVERIIVCRFRIIATQFRNLATVKKENRTPNSRLLQWLGLGIIWKILCFFQSYFYICERQC